jgi:hypothetical protein
VNSEGYLRQRPAGRRTFPFHPGGVLLALFVGHGLRGQIDGITILERHVSGTIVAAAIHHRPVGAMLRFSAEIRDRLAGVIPADHFLKESA